MTTVKDCIRVVDAYCGRWKIEEFHRTWKRGGKNIERSQLRTVDAIKRWATILAAVAARVERLKTLSREEPSRPATEFLSSDEIFAIRLRSKERNHFPDDWSSITIGEAAILIAYFGGWGGRSQGPPGSTILGRGLERVEEWALVVKAIRELDEKK